MCHKQRFKRTGFRRINGTREKRVLSRDRLKEQLTATILPGRETKTDRRGPREKHVTEDQGDPLSIKAV